jgi:hypothetical protein
VVRCFGAAEGQVAITNPIYFEGDDYRAPAPEPAQVAATVRDSQTQAPVDGVVEVLRMVGREEVKIAEHPFHDGRFEVTAPATSRLRVRAAGYRPEMKSVFMDFPPLLDLMLTMNADKLSDWNTFETVRRLLREVRLEYQLAR